MTVSDLEPIHRLREHLPNYLSQVKQRTTQTSRMVLFADFLQKVFDVSLEEFSRQMERAVVSKVLLVRGRIDAVFGGLVIEFKVNLVRELETAKEELVKYLQSLLEERPTQSYLGMATDGVAFRVYKPKIDTELRVAELTEIDALDLSREDDLEKIYLWFDAYLFAAQMVPPTTEDLKRRFGAGSPTFAFVQDELQSLVDYLGDEPSVRVKMKNWARYLEIVYGDRLGDKELFARHTYLAILAKLLVFLRLSIGGFPNREEVFDILSGKAFERFGIYNLVDLDFFSWVLLNRIRHRVTNLLMGLLRELGTYDLSKIDEDVFKELYQELVDPEVRHELGEYYTPDWLAELLIEKALEDRIPASFLDPSCGSGTFLFLYLRKLIRWAKEEGMADHEILDRVQQAVIGIDIHPLAVTISRMNYVLAIRDLLRERAGPVHIPVYMGDSLRVPETRTDVRYGVPVYEIPADSSQAFLIPEDLARQPWIFDRVVDLMGRMAIAYEEKETNRDREEAEQAFRSGLDDIWHFKETHSRILEENFKTLLNLVDTDANSIWTFILKNIYRPVALRRRKFSMVAGNPPWLTTKLMKSGEYQSFLKEKYAAYGLLPQETHLFPHLEEATLFFRRSADLYLENEGTIAFVMPRSILVAQHHRRFLDFLNPTISVRLLVDSEGVEPLFNVPSCALVATKGDTTSFPLRRLHIEGVLPDKNSSLRAAQDILLWKEDKYTPPLVSRETKERSAYYSRFFQGATIVPRSFWFVRILPHPVMGFDPERPFVETDTSLPMKPPWNRIRLSGNVHGRYLFATLIGQDLLPFAHFPPRLVVLPTFIQEESLKMLSSHNEARSRGHRESANYFQRAEEEWDANRTERSRQLSVYDRLNYRRGITSQNPRKRFKVLYTSSATYLISSLVDTHNMKIVTNGAVIEPTAFVAESKTYGFETDDETEALYVCAILNAPYVDSFIKESQTRGLFGARDIHKRPLTLPIPSFDSTNDLHANLVDLAHQARTRIIGAISSLEKYRSTGKRRREAKELLRSELQEINGVVRQLLVLKGSENSEVESKST